MKFGEFVRERRAAKNIGLRQMSKMIRVSPTYLSKVERDEFPPPAEDKVKAIAGIIGCDADDLLARANRVPSDVIEIIKSRPMELARLVRSTTGLPPDIISSMVAWAQIEQRGLPGADPQHPQQQNVPGARQQQEGRPGAAVLQRGVPRRSQRED
jgi:transcriptional regulator with XRE-family HTH domain